MPRHSWDGWLVPSGCPTSSRGQVRDSCRLPIRGMYLWLGKSFPTNQKSGCLELVLWQVRIRDTPPPLSVGTKGRKGGPVEQEGLGKTKKKMVLSISLLGKHTGSTYQTVVIVWHPFSWGLSTSRRSHQNANLCQECKITPVHPPPITTRKITVSVSTKIASMTQLAALFW